MKDSEFYRIAREHGFTENQAGFLVKFVSRYPHEHTAEQITDLDEAVEEILDEREE